jgi:putative DNA primase/helicase
MADCANRLVRSNYWLEEISSWRGWSTEAALAGELAIESGIVSWEPGWAQKAAHEIFDRWCATQDKIGELGKEHIEILRKLKDFIDRYGDSRFSDVAWSADPP